MNCFVPYTALLGQLDTLVPSALKANKFSGPPAFWSPQTWFGPPHMCAVCGNFKDQGDKPVKIANQNKTPKAERTKRTSDVKCDETEIAPLLNGPEPEAI